MNTESYIESKMPAVRAEFNQRTGAGEDPAEIVGLICNGKGKVARMGEKATVIPLALARQMFGTALAGELSGELPEFTKIAEVIERPPPGMFVTLYFVGDDLGVVGYHYMRVQDRQYLGRGAMTDPPGRGGP